MTEGLEIHLALVTFGRHRIVREVFTTFGTLVAVARVAILSTGGILLPMESIAFVRNENLPVVFPALLK